MQQIVYFEVKLYIIHFDDIWIEFLIKCPHTFYKFPETTSDTPSISNVFFNCFFKALGRPEGTI